MKKYAIIIGEGNKDLSRRVQEALFAVGFERCGMTTPDMDGSSVIILEDCNFCVLGHLEHKRNGIHDECGVNSFVNPSYVIENAHKLDGAVPQKNRSHFMKGGTGVTNFTSSLVGKYRRAIAEYGGGLEIIEAPMSCAGLKEHYSLHRMEEGGCGDLSDFWHIFDNIDKPVAPKKMTVAQVSALVGEDVVIVEG